ncbi:hypothetical protein EPN96_01695 [bacterium]|nr:MAG: hypothetical protein EPN96_01695 [bacterium]
MRRQPKWTDTLLLLSLLLLLAGCAALQPVTLAPGKVDLTPVGQVSEGRWFIWVDEVADLRGAPAPEWFGELDFRFHEQNAPAYLKPAPKDYLKENFSRMLLDAGLEASKKEMASVYAKVELLKFQAKRNSVGIADELAVEIDYRVTFTKANGEVIGTIKAPGTQTMKTPSGGPESLEKMTREVVKSSLEALAKSDVFLAAVKAGAK